MTEGEKPRNVESLSCFTYRSQGARVKARRYDGSSRKPHERDQSRFLRCPCRGSLRIAGARVYGPFALASGVAGDVLRKLRIRKSC
jgi:hypothetical protein